MSMMTDAAWKICQRNGGIWGSHLDYPLEDWKYEVTNNDTRMGYWNWVESKIEQEEDEG